MSNVSPRERSRHPLLLALFLVTMIAEIAIYFAGSVRSEVQAASVQDRGQGPENMDHEKTINLDGDWFFLWRGHDQKLQRVTLHMQQDGTRLVVTCRYSGSFCRMPSQVGTIQGTRISFSLQLDKRSRVLNLVGTVTNGALCGTTQDQAHWIAVRHFE
jgi:hypothetical protein